MNSFSATLSSMYSIILKSNGKPSVNSCTDNELEQRWDDACYLYTKYCNMLANDSFDSEEETAIINRIATVSEQMDIIDDEYNRRTWLKVGSKNLILGYTTEQPGTDWLTATN